MKPAIIFLCLCTSAFLLNLTYIMMFSEPVIVNSGSSSEEAFKSQNIVDAKSDII